MGFHVWKDAPTSRVRWEWATIAGDRVGHGLPPMNRNPRTIAVQEIRDDLACFLGEF